MSGENSTTGFCRIDVPSALMNDAAYTVFVNDTEVPYTSLLQSSNDTYSYLYFTHNQSTQEVTIIPELHSLLIQCLLMISTFLAVTLRRRMRGKIKLWKN